MAATSRAEKARWGRKLVLGGLRPGAAPALLAAATPTAALLVSQRLCPVCQNSSVAPFWQTGHSPRGQPEALVSLLELPGAGGWHFLTFASSPRWVTRWFNGCRTTSTIQYFVVLVCRAAFAPCVQVPKAKMAFVARYLHSAEATGRCFYLCIQT